MQLVVYPEIQICNQNYLLTQNTQKCPQHHYLGMKLDTVTQHAVLRRRANKKSGHSYVLAPRQSPGSGCRLCWSRSCTADGPAPAERNPQAGTSQPVRHASLTPRP